MFCSKCGKQIEEGSKFCKECGATVGGVVQQSTPENHEKQRSGVLELVVGLVPIFLILYILYVSNGRVDIIFNTVYDVIFFICMLIASIVGIVTRKNVDKRGSITAGVIYFSGVFFWIVGGILVGKIPGLIMLFIPLICSAIFFYCAFKRKKS
jgi:hypothetical protein